MIAYEQHLETVARKNSLLTGRDRDWLGVGVKEKRAEGKKIGSRSGPRNQTAGAVCTSELAACS